MTYHSIKRTCERANKKYRSAVKMIERAEERGFVADDLPSKERKYLKNKQERGKSVIVFYLGYLFILSCDGICITMYKAPEWFCKKECYIGKTKIRNPKKYTRYCDLRAEAV